MKKIHLRGVSKTLCESEMKDVRGGISSLTKAPEGQVVDEGGGNGLVPCGKPGNQPCAGKKAGQGCTANDGRVGVCKGWPSIPPCLICWLG